VRQHGEMHAKLPPQPVCLISCVHHLTRPACSSCRLRLLHSETGDEGQKLLGSDAEEVDNQVNAWLAKSKVHVRRTNTAFTRLRDKGRDALTGRTQARYGVGIAISIWYGPDHAAK
jgi:hypothetical protein